MSCTYLKKWECPVIILTCLDMKTKWVLSQPQKF